MGAGRRVIAQVWHDHFKAVILVALVAWLAFIVFAHNRVSTPHSAGTAPQGLVSKLLPVGALPVT